MFGFRIHKEGYASLLVIAVVCILLLFVGQYTPNFISIILLIISIFLFVTVLQFFRNPKRIVLIKDDNLVYAPADGKVVVMEQTEENEYFHDKRLMISIFMSPINVHVNRNPIGGIVEYSKYHPGKYLVAWHPKSSTENERTTVVINNGKSKVLFRQVAGALAKRIVNYLEAGQQVVQGADMGFIKFGSRVDVYLPLDAKIKVHLNEVVKGNITVIAELA
jgi:phosphatidylserine decarboxylase